jgi:hypothetical protein
MYQFPALKYSFISKQAWPRSGPGRHACGQAWRTSARPLAVRDELAGAGSGSGSELKSRDQRPGSS